MISETLQVRTREIPRKTGSKHREDTTPECSLVRLQPPTATDRIKQETQTDGIPSVQKRMCEQENTDLACGGEHS